MRAQTALGSTWEAQLVRGFVVCTRARVRLSLKYSQYSDSLILPGQSQARPHQLARAQNRGVRPHGVEGGIPFAALILSGAGAPVPHPMRAALGRALNHAAGARAKLCAANLPAPITIGDHQPTSDDAQLSGEFRKNFRGFLASAIGLHSVDQQAPTLRAHSPPEIAERRCAQFGVPRCMLN